MKNPDGSPSKKWNEAKMARPYMAKTEDGTNIAYFILRQEEATVLPMDPAAMISKEGEDIEHFSLVLTDKSGENPKAQLLFYPSVPYLSEFVDEIRKPFVLLRPMSEQEMEDLISHVNMEMQRRKEMNECFKKNLSFINTDHLSKKQVDKTFSSDKAQIQRFSGINFPTGKIALGDLVSGLHSEQGRLNMSEEVEAGQYDLEIALRKSDLFGIRVSGLRLVLDEEEAIEYKLADLQSSVDARGEDPVQSISIQGGLLGICDESVASDYQLARLDWKQSHEEGDFLRDYIYPRLKVSAKENPGIQKDAGSFARIRISNEKSEEEELVILETGFGDGQYSVFWGLDKEGKKTSLLMVFIDPDLFE